jgi:DMSO/TMAO reductase YedYZ heme-binding membrane subunit
VVHYYWLVKSDHRLPLLYGAIPAVLLLYRLGDSLFKSHPGEQKAPQPSSSLS